MKHSILLVFILSITSCCKKSILKEGISDCQLASLIINQIDILDDHKDINNYILLIDNNFKLNDAKRLSNYKFVNEYFFNFNSCDDFKITNKKVKFYSKNPCSDSITPIQEYEKMISTGQCKTIEISNLFVFEKEYVIRISIYDTGFYAGTFRFEMNNFKLHNIAMDNYIGNFEHPGTKSLFLKYPMIKN